jgi:hypothetical protein
MNTDALDAARLNAAILIQKMKLRERIKQAEYGCELLAILNELLFLADVWHAAGCKLDAADVAEWIRIAALSVIQETTFFLSSERKNSRVRGGCEVSIERCREVLRQLMLTRPGV